VRAEHGLHREALEQPVAHHLAGAAAAFFGRLEDEVHGAIEVAVLRQVLGGSEQHRRVAVVAAGVHLPGLRALVREGVELGDRQGVHVGAQSDRARARAVPDAGDDAGPAEASLDRDAPGVSCAATRSEVRFSSKQSSGWAWMSRRMAVIWAASARMDSMTCMRLSDVGRVYRLDPPLAGAVP
jgi:hypothetical protein